MIHLLSALTLFYSFLFSLKCASLSSEAFGLTLTVTALSIARGYACLIRRDASLVTQQACAVRAAL
jgi:hypothetical protein